MGTGYGLVEMAWSLGAYRVRSVGRVLCTDRFQLRGMDPPIFSNPLEEIKSFVVPVRNPIPFSRCQLASLVTIPTELIK